MILKIFTCSFIIIISSMIGFEYASRLSNRIKNTKQLLVGILKIEDYISFMVMPLSQIYEELGRDKGIIGKIFRNATVGNIESFKAAVNKLDGIQVEDKEILIYLGEVIGTSDIDNQLKSISMCKIRLEENLENAKDKYQNSAKLYKSLGILGGIFVAILLF